MINSINLKLIANITLYGKKLSVYPLGNKARNFILRFLENILWNFYSVQENEIKYILIRTER